jgi:signal transduction histidine kinase
LLFVPIRKEGETVGVLSVQSYALRRYSEEDIPLLQELADLIGPPLVNVYLREELEEQRAAAARHERLRALEQMASGIAHNFNNLLTGVLGYADLALLSSTADPELRTLLERIRDSAVDAAKLIERLQQFYRSRSRSQELLAMDLAKLVRETVELTRPHWQSGAQEHGAVINVVTELAAVPPVLGQLQELRDALISLLLNAVDAMPSGGTITLRLRQEDQEVVLEVADTGVGMSTDMVEHCFEPFFHSRGMRGSGLGLAIVHGVVTRHRGQISVKSEPGSGTIFTIRFPAGSEAIAKTALPESRLSARPVRQLRILNIDDEPAVRGVIRMALQLHKHHVVSANSGPEGIQAFAGEPFDLVITDLGMPGMDGREVAREIKRRSPQTPVILLTGWGQYPANMEGVPVDRIVAKPVNVSDLLAVVQEMAGQRQI